MIIHKLHICLDVQYQNANLIYIKINVDLCGGPVVKTVLPPAGGMCLILDLVGELRFPHVTWCSQKKKKIKFKKSNF